MRAESAAHLEVVPLRELHLLPAGDAERDDGGRRLGPHERPLLLLQRPPLAHPRLLQHDLGGHRRRARAQALARPQVVRARRTAA